MKSAGIRPFHTPDPLEALVHDLTEASAWAETAIQSWLDGNLPWPPEAKLGSMLAEISGLLVAGKRRWETIADPRVAGRLTLPQREGMLNCVEYFELAGLRLQRAATSSEARHLQDASASIQLGRGHLLSLVTTMRRS